MSLTVTTNDAFFTYYYNSMRTIPTCSFTGTVDGTDFGIYKTVGASNVSGWGSPTFYNRPGYIEIVFTNSAHGVTEQLYMYMYASNTFIMDAEI